MGLVEHEEGGESSRSGGPARAERVVDVEETRTDVETSGETRLSSGGWRGENLRREWHCSILALVAALAPRAMITDGTSMGRRVR